MKYIKTNEEFNLIKSFSDQVNKLSWKQIIIGISVYTAICVYGKMNHKLTDKEIVDVINDVDNIPTIKENSEILRIKKELINNIKEEHDLTAEKKEKLINDINNIPFVSIDGRTIKAITGNKSLGCYFSYYINNKFKNVILFDEELLIGENGRSTIFHELRHLIDHGLEDNMEKYYSESSNIIELLDKDIITQTPIGKKKLDEKILTFCINQREMKTGKLYNEMDEEDLDKINKNIKILNDILLSDKEILNYLTKPSEIYARFHGLKRFLLKNGYIHNMNDEITQQHIIDLVNDSRFFNALSEYDFFELIFYMNVDFTGKTKSDMTKANSIVTNYNEYINKSTKTT